MTYDQAQSPRLGQRVAPETPGQRLVLSTELPEAPWLGQLVYTTDLGLFAIYDGAVWQYSEIIATPTVIATSAPFSPTAGLNWFNPTTQVLSIWTGAWVEVRDHDAVSTLAVAAAAQSAAAAAQVTANTALAAATAPIGTDEVGTAQLAPSAITSKHTLTNPTVNAATMSGNLQMSQMQINNAATVNTTAMSTTAGNTFITMPEIRPTECYLRNVPVSTGGAAIFMGSTGRLFQHTSAKKYKKNIKDLRYSYELILALRPVSYDMRKNVLDEAAETDGTGEIGFIADEAAELGLEPLVGRGDDGGVETFHYYKLPILQQIVLREQQARINQLEERITALEGALTEPGD